MRQIQKYKLYLPYYRSGDGICRPLDLFCCARASFVQNRLNYGIIYNGLERDHLRIRSCILAAVSAILISACGCGSPASSESSAKTYSRDIFAMDTYMSIRCYGGGDKALDAAEKRIRELEVELSVTSPDSDVARINASAGSPVEVSADTAAIVKRAAEIGRLTGGALDVTAYPLVREWGFTTGEYRIPDKERIDELLKNVDLSRISISGNYISVGAGQQLDLGALAKGYTGDEVIKLLRENGAEAGIISLGGNVQSFGKKPDGSAWKVAVRDPYSPETDMCTVETGEKAVITSGNYERCFTGDDGKNYWHIIDPADGCPADNGIVSATIIGDVGLDCDALSTAMFVKGLDGAVSLWRNDATFDMILVTDDGRIYCTEGIADCFSNLSGMPAEVICRD